MEEEEGGVVVGEGLKRALSALGWLVFPLICFSWGFLVGEEGVSAWVRG